jgi:2-(1,2-epoxy-1,2-dihydrophenyl)acetyl-CoA isomerase
VKFDDLLVEKFDGGVGVVTLNRPHRLNALSSSLRVELSQALDDFEQDEEVGCIVITGSGGKAFSAGADIHEMAAGPVADNRVPADFWWDVATISKPTIGAINGLAFGGAAMLASSLDIRIGCERSSFRFLAASYGRMNSTWSLPSVVGWAKAKELLYTARIVPAEEALRMGLLNEIVPSDQLLEAAVDMGRQIAANSPEAVRGLKRLLIEGLGRTWREAYDAEQAAIGAMEPSPVTEAFEEFLRTRRASD